MPKEYSFISGLTVAEIMDILDNKDAVINGLRGDYMNERTINQRLEDENKKLVVNMATLRRQFAEYSQNSAAAIDGLINILEAFEDVLQYEDGPREVVKFIKAFVARERRRLPKWVVKPEGHLSIDDDIPF